jgi:hypothetical protein
LRSKLTVQASFVHPSRLLAAGPTERQLQALLDHADCSGSLHHLGVDVSAGPRRRLSRLQQQHRDFGELVVGDNDRTNSVVVGRPVSSDDARGE